MGWIHNLSQEWPILPFDVTTPVCSKATMKIVVSTKPVTLPILKQLTEEDALLDLAAGCDRWPITSRRQRSGENGSGTTVEEQEWGPTPVGACRQPGWAVALSGRRTSDRQGHDDDH